MKRKRIARKLILPLLAIALMTAMNAVGAAKHTPTPALGSR